MGSSSSSIKRPISISDGNNRVAQRNISSLKYGKRSSDIPALALLTKRLNEVKCVQIANVQGVTKVITETTATLKKVIQYAMDIYALLTELQSAVRDMGLKLTAEMNVQLKQLDAIKRRIQESEANTLNTTHLSNMQEALKQIGRSYIDGINSFSSQIDNDVRPSRAEKDSKNKNESILRIEMKLQDLHNQQIELQKLITETQSVLQQCQQGDLTETSINKLLSLLDKFSEVENHITSLQTFKKQLEVEERKQQDEERRRQEEERKRREEEQKRRDEEQRIIDKENRAIAEEKRRIAEEDRIIAEEKQRRDEERKAMELDKLRKQEEEEQERQRIEVERRQEEERKRIEEDQKRRNEQQQIIDEKNRKIAEEKRKVAEENRRKAEEKRKRDEERKAIKLEKQRKQQEEDQERQRIEEERRRSEEERKKQNERDQAIKMLNLKLSKKEKPDWDKPDKIATLKYERNHDEVDGNKQYHKNIGCFVLVKKDTLSMNDIHCDVEDVKDSDVEGTFRADSSLKTGEQLNSEKIRLTPSLPITEKIHARVFIPHEDVDHMHEASIMGCVDGGKWENQVLVYPKPYDDNEDLNLVGAEISFNKEASFVSVSKRKGMFRLRGREH